MATNRRRVILTAGHLGFKTGAWREWFDEGTKTIALRDLLTKELKKKHLEVKNDSNHERTGNVIKWINEQFDENDLFIEIHFNAVDNPRPSGTESYVQLHASTVEKNLGSELCRYTSEVLRIPNRGLKLPAMSHHQVIGVIDRTKVNAVLWEVCFMSNPNDVKAYRENLDQLVKSIATVIFEASKI